MNSQNPMPPPDKTLREVLGLLRAQQNDVNTQIVWQDFLELSPEEQLEVLFRGLIASTQSAEWAVKQLKEQR